MCVSRYDRKAQMELIWNALHFYREEGISEASENEGYEHEWCELTSVMAWIEEDLNILDIIEEKQR